MTRLSIATTLMCLCALSAPHSGVRALQARRPTNPPYLASMPTPDQIRSVVKGTDSIDTAARQAGVFWQLRQMIHSVANSQRRPEARHTPDERRLANEYWAAWGQAWVPVQRALVNDKPRLFKLEGYTVMNELLNEALIKLNATAVIAEYEKADQTFARWREQNARATEAVKAAWAEQQKQNEIFLKQLIADDQKRIDHRQKLARCLAADRAENQCLTEALGRDGGALNLLATPPRPAGLTLSGVYSGQNGFGLTFYPDSAIVECGGVTNMAGYTIERANGQLIVKLRGVTADMVLPFAGNDLIKQMIPQRPAGSADEWQSQRITLTLQPGGTFAVSRVSPAPATSIDVTGQVATGTGRTTSGETVTVYTPVTRTCALTPLRATGPSSPFGSASTALSAGFNLLFDVTTGAATSSTKLPPPGVRLHGNYVGANGFDAQFYPESAVIGCRDAVAAGDYQVTPKGAQMVVTVRAGAAPISFELAADGSLAGPPQARIDGRALVGFQPDGGPLFKQVSETCQVGTLRAK